MASKTNPVDRLYAAYRARDARRAAELYAPDGWHREVATGRLSRGRDAIESGLAAFLTAFPDCTWEVERRIAGGPHEAIAYRLTGTLQEPLGPIEPHDQRLDLRGVHVVVCDSDRIASSEDYWDALTFRRQMSGA